MEPSQLLAILDALETEPPMWRTLFHLMIVTGCRRAEIAAVRWSQIDFARHILTVDRSLTYSDGKMVEGPTKTSSIRRVSLPDETMDILNSYRDLQAEERLAAEDTWTGTEDYLFVHENGQPIGPYAITRWTYGFCVRHNLPKFHPHTLRHSLASLLIADGMDIVTVSRRLGHARPAMTLDVYAHVLEKADRAATDSISRVLLQDNKKGEDKE